MEVLSLKDRFRAWWKRSLEQDFVYEDDYVSGLARAAAEAAYNAGWRAAKRDK